MTRPCEILSGGALVDPVFSRKEPLGVISYLHGHGRQTSVFSSVTTSYCPWCRSTFSTTQIARKRAAASMLSGHCRVDAGAFPWPISPPQSLQCRCVMVKLFFTSIDELCDHSGAVHLAKPSPVSLPIASVVSHLLCRLMPTVLERTTPALEDALTVDDAKKRRLTRRKSGGGGVVQQRQARRQKQERAETRSPAGARNRSQPPSAQAPHS